MTRRAKDLVKRRKKHSKKRFSPRSKPLKAGDLVCLTRPLTNDERYQWDCDPEEMEAMLNGSAKFDNMSSNNYYAVCDIGGSIVVLPRRLIRRTEAESMVDNRDYLNALAECHV